MPNQYKVVVRTGDRPKAGTDANVYIKLHGEDGNTSDSTALDVWWKNDFERGQEDHFHIRNMPFATLHHIEVWRDAVGSGHEWFIDTISVINETTNVTTVFPVFRWITENFRYNFIPNDTSLPQDDACIEQRQKEIADKRALYQIEAKQPGIPMMLKTLPADEEFSFKAQFDIGAQSAGLVLEITRVFSALQKERNVAESGRWRDIEELKSIYDLGADNLLPPPGNFNRYNDDVEFGRQRTASINNIWIRQCTTIPTNLAVTEAMVEPFLEGSSLSDAFNGKKVFYIDYAILDGCPSIQNHALCAPIAMFYQRNNGDLVPIAIQLYQNPSSDNPVFLPSDPEYTWIMAKMWFNNADAAIHEGITHLGYTHLAMEGFSAITHRNMSLSHPIFKLLAPHFLYIHAINASALTTLINPGGIIDTNMNVGVEGVYELIRRFKLTWRLDVEGTLPADLKERGLSSPDILPGYHFREDAVPLYDAIKSYVDQYLSVYYFSDDAILSDDELKNWREEMVATEAEGGLSILGVPGEDGKFTRKEDVSLVLTSIIYTCSVGHAAANFKQYDAYCFPPNYPLEMHGTPMKNKDPLKESDMIDAIADIQSTITSNTMVTILSTRSTQALGDFEVNYVFDPNALPVIEAFRERIKEISQNVKDRNATRAVEYPYLDPAEIPNAISI